MNTQRLTIEDQAAMLRVMLPKRTNGLRLSGISVFLALCIFIALRTGQTITLLLPLWLSGRVFAEGVDFAGLSTLAMLTVMLCVASWLGVVVAIYTGLWQWLGREMLEVTAQAVRVHRRMLRFSRTQTWRAALVNNLRFTARATHSGGNTLAFDADGRTVYFGAGVAETDAQQILNAIVKRFPQYATSHSD